MPDFVPPLNVKNSGGNIQVSPTFNIILSDNLNAVRRGATSVAITVNTGGGGGSSSPTFPEVYENGILVTSSARVLNFLDSNVEVSGTTSANIYHNLPQVCQGRLTLQTGTAATTVNASNGTLFYAPFIGNLISLYDGTRWKVNSFNELSVVATACSANTNYDVFVNSSLVLQIGTAWAGNNTPAVGLVLQDGILVRGSDTTSRYIGTIRAESATTIHDTKSRRFVFNYYNRIDRPMIATDNTSLWTYATAAWRSANASTANRVEIVNGQADTLINLSVTQSPSLQSANAEAFSAIGEDSTTAPDTDCSIPDYYSGGGNVNAGGASILLKIPAIGYHFYQWIEYTFAGTVKFQGTNGNIIRSALIGDWKA